MNDYRRKPSEIVGDALRAELKALLSECSERQQGMFSRIYPGEIDAMSEHDLKNAISLCQRTLTKNRLDPARVEQS